MGRAWLAWGVMFLMGCAQVPTPGTPTEAPTRTQPSETKPHPETRQRQVIDDTLEEDAAFSAEVDSQAQRHIDRFKQAELRAFTDDCRAKAPAKYAEAWADEQLVAWEGVAECSSPPASWLAERAAEEREGEAEEGRLKREAEAEAAEEARLLERRGLAARLDNYWVEKGHDGSGVHLAGDEETILVITYVLCSRQFVRRQIGKSRAKLKSMGFTHVGCVDGMAVPGIIKGTQHVEAL